MENDAKEKRRDKKKKNKNTYHPVAFKRESAMNVRNLKAKDAQVSVSTPRICTPSHRAEIMNEMRQS
jgi:hypothetical protein